MGNDYDLIGAMAVKKLNTLKDSKLTYLVSSVLAGMFVGICMITMLVMAGLLNDFAGIKILQGVSFAAALSLVIFAGSELFTGNVFVMTAGVLLKTVKAGDAVKLCAYCYFGNFIGSMLIAALYLGTGYLKGHVLTQAVLATAAKTTPSFSELFIRGILCNILVCVAAWCAYKMKTESGKLIMIFWSIYLFVVCGFEHCIANMTLFGLGAMANNGELAFSSAMLVNLAATTPGNIIGGAVLSLAYWRIMRKAT